jgi:hypothetical protein
VPEEAVEGQLFQMNVKGCFECVKEWLLLVEVEVAHFGSEQELRS